MTRGSKQEGCIRSELDEAIIGGGGVQKVTKSLQEVTFVAFM